MSILRRIYKTLVNYRCTLQNNLFKTKMIVIINCSKKNLTYENRIRRLEKQGKYLQITDSKKFEKMYTNMNKQ